MSSTLLEVTVERWAEVLEENEQDKHLVEPQQLKQWEDFAAKTTARIKKIISEYSGDALTDTDRDWLKDLGQTIESSKRVPREELEKKKAEREEAERLRLQEEKERKEAELKRQKEVELTKSKLLGKLKF